MGDIKILGRGPIGLRVLVAILGLALIGTWLTATDPADAAVPAVAVRAGASAAPTPSGAARAASPVCDDNPYVDCYPLAKPKKMKKRFKDGKYGTAKDIKAPRWVFKKAKRYVRKHPEVAPVSARPIIDVHGRRLKDWDWGWLEWTAKKLNNTRCVTGPLGNASWFFGCDDLPDLENTVRRVQVTCHGAMVLIGAVTKNPIGMGSGYATCLWGQIRSLSD
ncbi:hypothetical protein E8D34_18985 [Nocardioides sp. GY 10113]|uniref:hypothetical protein n=1 Tax=Nocardioides sp. GY 10113 TaxID=2569761 RepID=UPI0010A8E252|nr:hypothetical protein [Nocardioides sp. GY 10113]TIC80471.1 hypothetical protein E8D34_18985 [Nocardioides sp. GY 10113]